MSSILIQLFFDSFSERKVVGITWRAVVSQFVCFNVTPFFLSLIHVVIEIFTTKTPTVNKTSVNESKATDNICGQCLAAASKEESKSKGLSSETAMTER